MKGMQDELSMISGDGLTQPGALVSTTSENRPNIRRVE